MVRPSCIVLPGALLAAAFLHVSPSPFGDAATRQVAAQQATQETRVQNVISKQIGVSGDEAALTLEMENGASLEIALRSGGVFIDGDRVGGFPVGGELETAWRSLLGRVLALDNGPLAQALVDWSPPSGLPGGSQAVGSRLDQELESALIVPVTPAPNVQAPSPPTVGQVTLEGGGSVADLLRRADLLALLGEATEGVDLDAGIRLVVGQDVTVESGEVVEGSLIVVDGDATVEGTVTGDVVVTDGTLRILDGGSVGGDARLADAEIDLDGGVLSGSVVEVSASRTRALMNLSRLREIDDLDELEELDGLVDVDAIRANVRDDVRRNFRIDYGDRRRSFFGNVAQGIGGLIQNVVSFLIVLVLAGAGIRFFPDNVRRVERALEASPVRAGVVGIAGIFLLIPVWILGMVALAISLVGIPALIAWIPLFPLAAAIAFLLGYIAAAILLGRWIIDQDFQNLDFLRRGNDLHAAAAGIAALLVPYVLANVLQLAGGWLDWMGSLITAAGGLAGLVAGILGFGAVLLTRGGRRPLVPEPWAPAGEWTEEPWDDEWSDLESSKTDEGATSEEPEPADESEDGGDDEDEKNA